MNLYPKRFQMLKSFALPTVILMSLAGGAFSQNGASNSGVEPNDPVVQTIPPLDTGVSTDTWQLNPATVSAGEPFALMARNRRYTCGSSFDHMSVLVQDSVIALSLTSTTNPTVRCAEPEQPLGPTFRMPALKPGSYQVLITDAPACVWSQPACEIAVQQEKAGILKVSKVDPTTTFSFQPASAKAETAFDLSLLSYGYSCATEYSFVEYEVKGDILYLSYLPTENPAGICPAIYKPYGPTFHITGLKAGQYKVVATPGVACLYLPQPCDVAIRNLELGFLSIGETTVNGAVHWVLNPHEIRAETSTTLQLLSSSYGNCHTSFSGMTVKEENGNLDLGFSIQTDTSHVCIQDIRPFGPEFALKPLKSGSYPVRVLANACPENAVCLAGPEWMVVDTLTVLPLRTEFSLSPEKAEILAPFELHLQHESLPCGYRLSETQASVADNQIRLSFTPNQNLGIQCVDSLAFDVAFSVPGLKAGQYQVVLEPNIDCSQTKIWSETVFCDEAYQTQGLGTVVVGSALSLKTRKQVRFSNQRGTPTTQWILPHGGKGAGQNIWMITGRRLPIKPSLR